MLAIIRLGWKGLVWTNIPAYFISVTKKKVYNIDICGLFYKHMPIVKDDSSIVSKWSSKLIDNARVIIYDHHMFIVQATNVKTFTLLLLKNKLERLPLASTSYPSLLFVSKTRVLLCTGSVKANRRRLKSGLGRIFHFKLGCFVMCSISWPIQSRPSLELKTRPRVRPHSLSLSLLCTIRCFIGKNSNN
jgi:hypothetical protein